MGQFNDLLVSIGIDTKAAKKEIKKVEGMFDSLVKHVNKPSTSKKKSLAPFDTKKFKAETQEIIKTIKSMGGEVDSFVKKLNKIDSTKGLKNLNAELNEVLRDFQKLKELQGSVGNNPASPKRPRPNPLSKEEKEELARKKKLTKAETQAYIENLKREKAFKNQLEKDELARKKKLAKAETQAYIENLKRERKLESAIKRRYAVAEKAQRRLELSANYRRLPADQQREVMMQMSKAKERFIKTGDTYGFDKLTSDVREFRRSLVGLQTVQMGLADSAKNMVRAYASVFALVEGTVAIERIGMDFQGMEVAMLASAGSSQKAAKDLEFINNIADEMGVNLKDSADAYVKLQMASRGKMDDSQIKELFQGLTEFGTALKVAPESMKLAQRALSQMASKGQIMAI